MNKDKRIKVTFPIQHIMVYVINSPKNIPAENVKFKRLIFGQMPRIKLQELNSRVNNHI